MVLGRAVGSRRAGAAGGFEILEAGRRRRVGARLAFAAGGIWPVVRVAQAGCARHAGGGRGAVGHEHGVGLCVYAVSGEGLPWRQLAWTFPVILLLSGLPLTVAGVGVREVLSMVFLGWYGVPAAEAVAASPPDLRHGGSGLLGAAVLAREEAVQARCQARGPVASVSVIIPVLNEAEPCR